MPQVERTPFPQITLRGGTTATREMSLLNLRGGLCNNSREAHGHNDRGAHLEKLENATPPPTTKGIISDITPRKGPLHRK